MSRIWQRSPDLSLRVHKGRAKTEHVGGLKGGGRRVKVGVRQGRPGTTASFLGYLTREGVGIEGDRGRLFDAYDHKPETQVFLEQAQRDRVQYLVLLSPEMAAWINFPAYTREVLGATGRAVGQELDWVASAHYNSGHVHVHGLVRGRDVNGEALWPDRQGLQDHLQRAADEGLSSSESRFWQRSREGWER